MPSGCREWSGRGDSRDAKDMAWAPLPGPVTRAGHLADPRELLSVGTNPTLLDIRRVRSEVFCARGKEVHRKILSFSVYGSLVKVFLRNILSSHLPILEIEVLGFH